MQQQVPPVHHIKAYTQIEEWLNTVSHALGCIASIVGLVFLLLRAEGTLAQSASIIYGLSMISMFLSSTLYHGFRNQKIKSILKTVDHSAIYLLIAGTYTPFMLIAVGGWIGLLGIMLIWSLAFVGIMFKCFAPGKYPRLSVITYLLMGWIALLFIYPLYQALPIGGLWLLVCGGLCYTVGVIFYLAKNIRYTHPVWHLFVTAGCICHYFAIYIYVV
jgi:hemolysin III